VSLARNFSAAATDKDEVKIEVPLKLYSSAGRYASALYVSAAKKGKLIDVEEDLEYIRDAYKTLPRLNQYLNDPTIPKSEKTKGILSILDELKCNEVTKSFFGAPRWVGLYPCGMTSCHGLVGLMCCGCL